MRVSEFVERYRALRSQAPDIPSTQFALRVFAWQLRRLFATKTAVPLHRRMSPRA